LTRKADPHTGSRRREQSPLRVGIEYVIVNGVVTVEHGRHTAALAGRVLYGPGKK
jgi:hypothetical protein